MSKTLDDISKYVKDNFGISKGVSSLAFDSQGEVCGVILADDEVYPFFDKEVDDFQKFLDDKE